MHEVNLRKIDLNLLVLLDVLIDQRNVTRAAEIAHMSQPAMSRALGRLRRMLGDPILSKGSDGLMPTPKAIAMQPRLKQLLAEIQELVTDSPFDPALLEDAMTLSATDHQMLVLLPWLVTKLSTTAPKLTLKIVPLFNMTPEQLHHGVVDLVLGVWQDNLPTHLHQEVLACDRYITLMRRRYPAEHSLSIEQYACLDHVLVSALGDGHSAIDTILNDMGLQRHIALHVPSFFAAMQVVAQSNLVVTLPSQIAERYAAQLDLIAIETPMTCPPIQMVAIWSDVMDADPANRWLRGLVREAVINMTE
jgi:DNA-binding transcriptional LysR family regulator